MDSPRFTASLAGAIEKMGGVSWMVLSHIDDVGDHERLVFYACAGGVFAVSVKQREVLSLVTAGLLRVALCLRSILSRP